MAKKIDFSPFKKALIESWRVFIPAFIAIITAQFQVGVDLKDWRAWLLPLVLSASLAGFKAVVKYLRETYGLGDYTKLIYKLPL